ncbi:hypothetical protein M514_04573 [Trichuris suis]|uniref:Kelch repeat protein n=1 Tax=Trichuris suis TaxID=68888 RepID=A0A085MBN2_9BILA|nr:hypothetical protein M513_04573 [Trichuris suis]KFD69219.1 hypothetical protein M514_04573 [Trichuris suis]
MSKFEYRRVVFCRVPKGASLRRSCVVGGSNHAGPLCSVECYDVRQDAWTSLASMNVRRSMAAVVEYDGCLFSFGGFDTHDPLCTSEVYNPKENEWQFLNASNGIQGGCTAATVPILLPVKLFLVRNIATLHRSFEHSNYPIVVWFVLYSSNQLYL